MITTNISGKVVPLNPNGSTTYSIFSTHGIVSVIRPNPVRSAYTTRKGVEFAVYGDWITAHLDGTYSITHDEDYVPL
jgi:hypothetical protein